MNNVFWHRKVHNLMNHNEKSIYITITALVQLSSVRMVTTWREGNKIIDIMSYVWNRAGRVGGPLFLSSAFIFMKSKLHFRLKPLWNFKFHSIPASSRIIMHNILELCKYMQLNPLILPPSKLEDGILIFLGSRFYPSVIEFLPSRLQWPTAMVYNLFHRESLQQSFWRRGPP